MFPRARIQRFNEVVSDVPPPGTYDPKFESKVKGVDMDKMTERFMDPKNAGSSDTNIQRSASLSSLPVFRTPQSIRKPVKKTTPSVKHFGETPSTDKVRRNIDKEFSSSEDITSDSKDQLKFFQEQLDTINSKLEDSVVRCQQLEEDIACNKDTIERLQLEKVDLSVELDRLMFELADKSQNLSEKIQECNLLDANLAERKAAVLELEQSQTELLLEISVLREQSEKSLKELEQSAQHCAELEYALSEARNKHEVLLETKACLSTEVADLTDRLNEATMQIQARDEHCESLENAKREMMSLIDEKSHSLETLTSQLKDSETHSAELTSLLSEAKTHNKELDLTNATLMEDIKNLECELGDVSTKLESYQMKCDALHAEVEVQKQIISQMEDTKAALSSELMDVKVALQTSESCLGNTQKSLEDAEAVILREQEEKSKLEGELKELSLFCCELQQKLQQRQQLILGLQADLSSSSCELEEHRAEAARQAKEYREEIERICAKHEEELGRSVADWEARVAQAQAEHEMELANLRDLAYKLEQRVLEEREAHARLEEQTQAQRDELVAGLRAAEQALEDEKLRAEEHIAALTRESEAQIAEIELSTRRALEEAELNMRAAEAAYTETLKQVHSDTQALLKATKAEALEELEKMKAESERKVHKAQEELSAISDQLLEVQDELHQVIAVKDNLKSSDLEKQVTIVELQDRVNMMELERIQSLKMVEEAEEKLKAVNNELDLMKKIRRNLEIIGQETLATVNAVSKRLLESDDEVVRLSQVNSVLETNLNEQKESLTAMEKENIREIEEIRFNLLSKVDTFKQNCIDENMRLQEQIQVLQESVLMYAGELEEANRNLESLERDRNEQATMIAHLQQTTNELQATQDFLTNQVDDYVLLKRSHKALQGELDDCKDQLSKARAEAADGEMEIQHREKQIAELSNQLDDLNDKMTELQGVILELETTAVERENQIEQLECKLEYQKECAQKANWQMSDLTKENEEIRNLVDQLNSEFQLKQLDAKQQLEALAATKADLQSQIESMNTVLECHKMNVLKATERIENLDNSVILKEKEIMKLSAEIAELKNALLVKASKVSDLTSMIEDKNHALLSSHHAIDGLLSNVKSNEKQIRDLSADLSFEKAFRVECELKLTEVLQDKLDCEVLLEDVKEKVLELESAMSEKNDLISSLELNINNSAEKMELLKAEAKNSLCQISEAEKNIIVLEAGKLALQNDISSLTAKVGDQWAIIEKQQADINVLNSEIQTQGDLVTYLKARLEENRTDIKKLEDEKMSIESELSALKMQGEMTQWESEEALRDEKNKCISLETKVSALEEQLKCLELKTCTEKSLAHEREEVLNEELTSLKKSLGAKTQEVGTMKGRQQQLESELDQTTRRKETYKAAVVELQQAVKQSRSKMQTLEEELQTVRLKLTQEREEHQRKMDETMKVFSSTNDWKVKYEELESLIGPFREQLEAFESERQALESRKEAAEDEVKDLAQRYAEILGHQNHKQKIHHVVKLKEQILDLKKEKEKLESQNRSQKRIIEKLKDEISHSSVNHRFNPSMAFKPHDDSLQSRLSLAQSKSLLDSSSLSKSLRAPSLQTSSKKGKENFSAVDMSTPLSSRSSSKVKDEILSPVRHSPVGSPITPLKEVQNQPQVN